MKKDIFQLSFDFIKTHLLQIIFIVVLLFGIVAYKAINNIKFHKSHPVLKRVVVIESFKENIKSGQKNAICIGNLETKNAACKELSSQKSCNNHNCCVWAKKKKKFSCLGGDSSGPTYDGGKYDEYYYKNKKFENN